MKNVANLRETMYQKNSRELISNYLLGANIYWDSYYFSKSHEDKEAFIP